LRASHSGKNSHPRRILVVNEIGVCECSVTTLTICTITRLAAHRRAQWYRPIIAQVGAAEPPHVPVRWLAAETKVKL
jgi:hypothetical protein